MIFLDTNFLIRATLDESRHDRLIDEWIDREEAIGTSVIAWAEFLCGPVTPERVEMVERFLAVIEPVHQADAVLAAEMFNLLGRRRGTLSDCLIAASCIRAGASLATENLRDFTRLRSFGLQIITER